MDDIYYLDGAELLPCTTQGGTHCTEIQNYARIKRLPGASSSPNDDTWTVTGTNGNVATYEPLFQTDGVITARWALTSIRDPNGNVVSYTYWCDEYSASPLRHHQCYPESITYGPAAIWFHLEGEVRPDPVPASNGYYTGLTRYRLRSIEVKFGQETARAYEILYDESADSGRSIVSSVQQFGRGAAVNATTGDVSGPDALPAMTMTYPSVGTFPGENFGSFEPARTTGSALAG